MQHQLQCNGLLEVCAIRQMGYPVRMDFALFLRRYQVLARGRGDNVLIGPLPAGLDGAHGLLARLSALNLLVDGQWAKGRSKIFLRAPQAEKLECWDEMRTFSAIMIQCCARVWWALRRRSLCVSTERELENAIASRSVSSLQSLLARGRLYRRVQREPWL